MKHGTHLNSVKNLKSHTFATTFFREKNKNVYTEVTKWLIYNALLWEAKDGEKTRSRVWCRPFIINIQLKKLE